MSKRLWKKEGDIANLNANPLQENLLTSSKYEILGDVFPFSVEPIFEIIRG